MRYYLDTNILAFLVTGQPARAPQKLQKNCKRKEFKP